MHGGTVHADSPGVGQGATFTVQIPLIKVRSPELNSRPQTPDFSPLPLNGLQVLVVDDEPDTREVLTFALEHYGAKVTAATSSGEALQMLEQLQPDVLVSDIGMPGQDGYTLIRKVREQGRKMPAIALTAYAREEDCQMTLTAGFQIHVSKPVEPAELAALVAKLAGSKQGLQQTHTQVFAIKAVEDTP